MLNKVELIGHVGYDPKIGHLPDGRTVANFSIATTKSYRDKKTNEVIKKTLWHNCVAYGGLAEKYIAAYIKKGTLVHICGELHQPEPFQNAQGIMVSTYQIIVKEILSLSFNNGNAKNNHNEPHMAMNNGAEYHNAPVTVSNEPHEQYETETPPPF